MKKIIIFLSTVIMVFLSGCSILGEVNNTLEYANNATGYIATAQSFAEEIPQLAEKAVTSTEAAQNLENELLAMKQEIEAFNKTDAPAIAEDIHNQIIGANKKLEAGIDSYLNNVENGKIDPAFLQDSQILTTINELNTLINQIERLGN
ncbi:hypothetical protein D0469_12775 [Peribacillus saganii]|uniref:Lipoprotein n=1 Tax=Peribacillus saganii TaxID=2303992 RepID=A0A372LP38_9BACI|nr:DUF6376 family protein [Peribacillus saganii]RFU68135.1 hypothetical protein D0469_12775 [Peribacillus saganii]